MKRLFVISLEPRHFILTGAALVVIAVCAIFWPRPAYGGEGGYCENIFTQAGDYSVSAPAFNSLDDPPGDPSPAEASKSAKLAIIIDDFGEGREGVQQMMSIGRHLTFAVMPFGTFTSKDADAGFSRGYEIIVHLPMEPLQGPPEWVGSNPILCSQDDDKIASITRMALADVPHAVGANVHMGSKASADDRVMHCILSEVHSAGFFFVDSRTGQKSVIKAVARELDVPCLERNVFLDGNRPESYVVDQLRLAENLALKNGYAVAIGHVGPHGGKPTAAAIASMLDEFDSNGVQLVFVSELFRGSGQVSAGSS